ncbi:hypothetical protein POVWA2_001130 [Plasmodium ovale wallikeri]|uniref:Uncharacterized protein n=1 Tax=Plasmodium ovale wallikeri TaxID=864142 RepID=A0A1A8YH52_PLAOA|nr:hypothetical protein POVWA1_000860 [Plasmodium ovale wallikeri]SBT30874.1 hypothetical protein POVWA2_001130 [Plasmodium ovale wallikeri]
MAAIGSAKKIGVNTYSGSLKKKNRDTTILSYASTVPIYAYIKLKDDQTAKHVSQFSKNKKGKQVGLGVQCDLHLDGGGERRGGGLSTIVHVEMYYRTACNVDRHTGHMRMAVLTRFSPVACVHARKMAKCGWLGAAYLA